MDYLLRMECLVDVLLLSVISQLESINKLSDMQSREECVKKVKATINQTLIWIDQTEDSMINHVEAVFPVLAYNLVKVNNYFDSLEGVIMLPSQRLVFNQQRANAYKKLRNKIGYEEVRETVTIRESFQKMRAALQCLKAEVEEM